MNERIRELALEAGLLNYVDLETPRRYFIDGYADIEEVEEFARLIVKECAELAASRPYIDDGNWPHPSTMIKQHFGVKE